MKGLNLFFLSLTFLCRSIVFGQEVFESKLIDWNTASISEYTGVYELGQQERQAFLRVIASEKHIIFQLKTNFQYELGGPRDIHYITFSNTTISKTGTVSFGEMKGKFVKYIDFMSDSIYCIRFYPPMTFMPSSEQDYELGKKKSLSSSYSGNYIQASTDILSSNDLAELSPKELKIMRNEIFARYGYIFKKGGEMNRYFNYQNWYKPKLTEVNNLLTEIERKNIQLIQDEETKRQAPK